MRTFTLGQFQRAPYQATAVVAILLGFLTTCVCADKPGSEDKSYTAGEVQGALDSNAGQLEIQFIGNAAFHITDGESTLLTDFPYKSGAYGYMQYRMEDVKPIKGGLCLITHPHLDHWDQELFEETDHAIIAPPDILKKVKSKKKIPFDDVMTYKDMVIEAFETRHDGRPRNFKHYSYLVTWHGLRLYIPGDAVLDHFLTMTDIDVMFVGPGNVRRVKDQKLTLDAKTLILFHHKSDQKVSPSEDCLVLKQGETLTVKFKQKVCPDKPTSADIIRSAAKEGKLAYKLTTPDEFKAIAGQPTKEWTEDDGNIIWMEYPGIRARFFGKPETNTPHTIISVLFEGRWIDIGQNRPVALRSEEDLGKLGSFWGYSGVDLSRLDLSGKSELLKAMPFDSRTVWPEPNKMPEGFDPACVLEEGRNPGLGIRNLHKQGIDGKGVGIAIIDQPLVKNHKEYTDNIVHLEEIDVQGVGPQMHGPAVASIAVGKNCGVAPSANLYYYAIPMWKWKNCQPYCDVINKILELNESLKPSERIQVVSISTGMFSLWNDFTRWEKTLRKAEQRGVLVITCDTTAIDYGTLTRIPGKDPDEYNNYRSGRNGVGSSSLLVPAGNRTTASHEGPEVYTYWTGTGMSWAAPYLAGLATLAYQVDPEIEPETIVKLWKQTAVHTDAGPIVNPRIFIECVQKPDKASALIAGIVDTKSKAPKWILERKPVKASQIPQEDYKYLAGWLDEHAKWPIDYFIELFKKHQIVIVGEQHNVKEHKNFVIKLLIPRLYHEAGVSCVGWEFSRHTDNERLNGLVSGDVFDKEAALEFARDQLGHEWNSKEHWDIIEAVWKLNKSLKPGQQKMRLIGLDKDWDAPKVQIVLKTKPQDSPEFQEVLKDVLKRDATMANQVEKEIIEKRQKGLVFVGRCHDFTHHKFPASINMGRDIMGNLLYEKYGDRVFQVWFSSGLLSPIEDVMKLRGHRPCGFDLYDSPFANILTPSNWDAPEVPLSNVARGFIYFGPRSNLHRNTPIKGFVTKEMFEQHKKYYEIDLGRAFRNAQDVDTYLQTHRFPKP